MIKGKIIAIDARMIEMSGIGTYIQHLMGNGIYDYAFGDLNTIRKYDTEVKVIPFNAPIYSLSEQVCFPNKNAIRAGISLIHFPHYNVPFNCRVKYVVTVHDLTHIMLPELLGNKLKYYYARFLMNHSLKEAEHVFTVSSNSKRDIEREFSINEKKISVTYNAVDSSFRVKEKQEIDYLHEKYSIPRDKRLLMYVGNLKPHKNLKRLLEALSRLDNRDNYRLILVGKAFSSIDLKKEEEIIGIQDLIIHTGVVAKEELVDLYNLVDLFVFPSLYEGFGIPPLEAMACGTPVIASDNSSIPEVVGDAAILFDATDVDELVNAIKICDSEKVKKDMIEKGFIRCSRYSWDYTIKKTLKDISSCV